MPEADEKDPRLIKAVGELSQHLMHFRARPMTSNAVDDVMDMVNSAASRFKAEHGLDFPPLGALVLPTSRQIVLYRLDLDDSEIRQKIVSLLRDFARHRIPVSTFEFARAVQQLWPNYKPPIEDIRKDPKAGKLLAN